MLRGGRAAEVKAWLDQHGTPARWLVIDDIDLRVPVASTGPSIAEEHIVVVDASKGLSTADADRAIGLLCASAPVADPTSTSST